jgi:CheY-like chemotaxis protein
MFGLKWKQMPRVDGIQSTRMIRQIGYQAPIVALTAFTEESNIKECMSASLSFFLPCSSIRDRVSFFFSQNNNS